MKANKTIAKIISTILIAFVFLFLAFGSGESDEKIKIDINDQQALEKYIQGKWSYEKHTGDVNHTWRYRFEIIGNKLKVYSCLNNTDDPFDMSGGYEEFNFTLGSPTRDVDGYKARFLEFSILDKTNFFGLTYEALSPFWLVSDDNWDTPVLRCGSGIPTWSRVEFQSTGNKISHNEINSISEETNARSDYSNSNTYQDDNNQTIANTEEQNLFVYPESSSRILTETDLEGLTSRELKIMRNEIFARYGYIFKTKEMISYFSQKTWYKARYDDVSDFLTPVEKKNIEFIKMHE